MISKLICDQLMNLGFLTNRCEFAVPKRYSGNGELAFAVIGCVLWFSAIVIRLGFSSKPWTLTEKLVEATSFVVFAALPILFLATYEGAELARRVLLRNSGLWFQTATCLLLGVYISVVKLLGLNPARFGWLNQFDRLIIQDSFWLNVILFLLGAFVVLRLPFVMLGLRDRKPHGFKPPTLLSTIKQNSQLTFLLVANFIYFSLVHTSLISTAFKAEYSGYFIGLAYILIAILLVSPLVTPSATRMTVFDLLLTGACLLSLFCFSRPFFSFGPFIGLTLFVLVVIFGTRLGREHFGYSFQIRKADVFYTVKAILAAALILVPLALLLRFTQPQASTFNLPTIAHSVLFFLSYAILFGFRVGLFEEILFRSGLMVFIRDQIQARSPLQRDRKRLVLLSAVIGSIIFGLCHIGNEPGAGIALSPFQYKAIYAALATLASMFYALAFGETNRLWASITIHGIVDTIAVLLLGASLVVPF
ncbi:CPBP family intramembrane metalloprotease [Leptolyngbya sp. FACHB-321]|uniref:CPBP family intramembrane glutamic endopeptidase n=1 Tax=Leptolyngbya sp. FACHB-321 TaxID=2692807 RepID=UPI0016829A9E|nr:CPBP family intramembrane glutamic endopeptidase [Leptolyngbya sp. FACHB-321]MBD2035806.1 CPBP family intramembrane metalloprotease [Leptolyngbya sp. FACHB-321]